MSKKQEAPSIFDLTEQAAIYGSYHSHPINRLIHFIFVPQILFAFILWIDILPIKYSIPFASTEISGTNHLMLADHKASLGNLSLIAAIAMCALFASLDVVAAGLLFILLTGLNATASSFIATYGPAQAFVLGVFFQVVGWGSQIVVGHGMFEGRAPAISENRFQAIVSPFFLALEALFMFGYRKSLYNEIEKRTQQKIAAWKASKKVL